MQQLNLEPINTPRLPAASLSATFTVRDGAAIAFRHLWLMVLSFLIVFLGVVAVTALITPKYRAQIKILVKRERADQVVSAEQTTQVVNPDLSEVDLNSEVELLKSRDLLTKVVVLTRLNTRPDRSFSRSARSWFTALLEKLHLRLPRAAPADDLQILGAVRELEENLSVEPLKKTRLIQVTYASPDAQLAADVLQVYARLYLEKHLAVHRPPGTMDFFQEQTKQYRKRLNEAEAGLNEFSKKKGVVAPQLEKEITVRKVNDFETDIQKTHAAIAETEQRIQVLTEQEASLPARMTTQVRTLDNSLLLQQLGTTLLNLELKRTELASKFTPDYRPLQEIEAQIKQTRETLTNVENNPLREETTDRDATREWIKSELVKARGELVALQAHMNATAPVVDAYRKEARRLNETEIVQQDLLRSAKNAEENFLLYSRKHEEARISDALDKQRIINVSVAEEATVPSIPSSPSWRLNLLLGFLFASLVSLGLVLAADCFFDRSFRTPDEVEAFLHVPVLAALPKN